MSKQVLVPDEKGRGFARAVRAGQLLFISGMTGQWDLGLPDLLYQSKS